MADGFLPFCPLFSLGGAFGKSGNRPCPEAGHVMISPPAEYLSESILFNRRIK
ncbi:Uncharacterized protein dnm_009130 [Desulfonema magnum]|uniref:Uncharacterized protein n=1 Tax=Desulfonema magnum TaxID=45655 RepID=A0A975BH23_9BACT|nr:Uncharacterized protein dnm_009130 [Desulfonema magnum]